MGKLIVGVNDLETWCKENNMNHLVEEWNDEKSITNFTKGSNYKAKWRCRFCGHEWQASIVHRTHSSAGCPECAKKTIARKKAKKVLCIDTGEIFNSLSAASRTKNTAISYISQCCRGKQRTAGGYHWRYVNENEWKNNIVASSISNHFRLLFLFRNFNVLSYLFCQYKQLENKKKYKKGEK